MKYNNYCLYILLIIFCNINDLFAEYISEARYDSLAMYFTEQEMKSTYDDFAFSRFSNDNNLRSFTQTHEYSISQDNNNVTYINKILVLVNDYVYEEMPDYIIRYAHDIHNAFGCIVDIVSISGGTPAQIKSLILSYSNNLNGVVMIGYIAPAFYYNAATSTGSTNWQEDTYPCDLFYMDLDGTWQLKNDGSGKYDDHTGNVKPEIFVGRINTSAMNNDEIEDLMHYMDRNHRYWTGKKVLNKQRALTFTYQDWNTSDFWNSVSPLYGNSYYDAVKANMFDKNLYVSYLQNNSYEFIQMASHSYPNRHLFDSNGDTTLCSEDIYSLNKKSIGYNLFCCSACRWTNSFSEQCLGESYLYGIDNNTEALAVIGSTKVGGMLGFDDFYTPLGNQKCIGEAYKMWWVDHCGTYHSKSEKLWFYGMTILGDPLVNFNFTNECDDILILNSGEDLTNRNYYAQNKIVVQNYSITQGQSVTMSAPTIHITGNFICKSPSVFRTNINDNCVCNNSTRDMLRNRINKNTNNFEKITTIFPNPVEDVLTIDTSETLEKVCIYNLSGQSVMQTMMTQINVANFPQGMYLLRATTTDGTPLQAKFIKQ